MNTVATPSIDFDTINQAALQHGQVLLREWLPDGRLQGHEWEARNPTRDDHKPGSFKINITTGQWSDFATPDKGSDLIALYAYLNRLSQGEAARALAQRLGLEGREARVHQRVKPALKAVKAVKPDWIPLWAVPGSAPEIPTAHYQHGKPTTVWTYHDAGGQPLILCLPLRSSERQETVSALELVAIRDR